MENELKNLINEVITSNTICSEEGLSAFLSAHEETITLIEKAALSNQWVYFTEQTYDGWYCLQKTSDSVNVDVFYKERGAIAWGITPYKRKSEAVASVLVQSGYASF